MFTEKALFLIYVSIWLKKNNYSYIRYFNSEELMETISYEVDKRNNVTKFTCMKTNILKDV